MDLHRDESASRQPARQPARQPILPRMLLGLVIAGVLAADSPAQAPELPLGMRSGYVEGRIFAERFHLLKTATDFIRCDVHLENHVETSVTLTYRFQKGGAVADMVRRKVSLSFLPMAAARRTGVGDRLYIVGWSPRTDRVMIEEFRFSQFGLGTATPVGGGLPRSLLTGPQLDRTVIWVSGQGAMAPPWDAACQFAADQLWLLDSATPRTLWSVDLTAGGAATPVRTSADPGAADLADHRTLSVGLNQAGGLMLFSERRKSWESHVAYDLPYTIYLFRDDDRDGGIDGEGPLDFTGLKSVYGDWNPHYGEP